MPIKNYYTVDGELIGESTVAGGHRTYGLDALGSVVATYDGTGALENTYRNAPYGTPVQKTGTAADPRFLWNGGSGYRNTSRNYSPYYVRARHLDYLTARWTSVDPWWPKEPAYGYAQDAPLWLSDPTGAEPRWPACIADLDARLWCESQCVDKGGVMSNVSCYPFSFEVAYIYLRGCFCLCSCKVLDRQKYLNCLKQNFGDL